MKVERLFQVLVITGASSAAGLVGCSDDNNPTPYPTGTGGSGPSGTGGSGVAGTGGSSASCDAVCVADPNATPGQSWTDCNGCCCWLPAGTTAHAGPLAICGEEPCCAGRGR